MTYAAPADQPPQGTSSRTYLLLPLILLAALAVRVVFFTGYFGSDEVTYTEQAVRLLQGEWPRSDYVGAYRLGITFPVALLMWIFGNTEFAANLWSLLCSLGEITLVFLLARHFWGNRAAVLASLILAFTPLHAHYAGRLMADAPLGFFVTLTFFAVFWGERNAARRWYFAAGLAAGMVWWIKSAVALVFLTVFALYVVRERRFAAKWLIMAAGFLAMALLNGLIFQVMEGNFWKLFPRIASSGIADYVMKVAPDSDNMFYLRSLFVDIKHTLLLGPLAAIGVLLWIGSGRRREQGLALTAIWGVGLVTIFSLFVVSVNPLLFITKQVNYMTIFLAPLALLAGYAVSRLNFTLAIISTVILVAFGVVGAALEQLAIQSFVANSKAAQAFAREHAQSEVFGMTNAVRVGNYERLFSRQTEDVPRIFAINLLAQEQPASDQNAEKNPSTSYVVFDRQTASWGNNGLFSDEKNIPECWSDIGELTPQGMGLSANVVRHLSAVASWLPSNIGQRITARLDAMLNPLPATVFKVDSGCLDSPS